MALDRIERPSRRPLPAGRRRALTPRIWRDPLLLHLQREDPGSGRGFVACSPSASCPKARHGRPLARGGGGP